MTSATNRAETCFCVSRETTYKDLYSAVSTYLQRSNQISTTGSVQFYADWSNKWGTGASWSAGVGAVKDTQYAIDNVYYVGGSKEFVSPVQKAVSFPLISVTKSLPRIQFVAVPETYVSETQVAPITTVSKQVYLTTQTGVASCSEKGAVHLQLWGPSKIYSHISKSPLCIYSGTTFPEIQTIVQKHVQSNTGMRLYVDSGSKFGYDNLATAHRYVVSNYLGKENVFSVDLSAPFFAKKTAVNLPLVRYDNGQYALQFYVFRPTAGQSIAPVRVAPTYVAGAVACTEKDAGKLIIIQYS